MILLTSEPFNWTTIQDNLLIAVVGYLVVLGALALLYAVFRYLPDLLHIRLRSRLRKEGKHHLVNGRFQLAGDEGAAIATALFLYFNEAHDEEDTTMTIKRISRRYSPWSSKIFGVMPQLKK